MKRCFVLCIFSLFLFLLSGCKGMSFEDMKAAAAYQSGVEAYSDGKYEKAIKKFEKATKGELQEEYLVSAYNYLGNCFLETGDLEKAESYYETALALAGPTQTAMCLTNQGVLKRKQNNFEGAEADYQAALSADAGYVPALRSLGVLFALTGRGDEAVDYLNRAIGLSEQKEAGLLADLAYAYAVIKDTMNAERYLRESLEAGYKQADADRITSYINQVKENKGNEPTQVPTPTVSPTPVPTEPVVVEPSKPEQSKYIIAIDPGHQLIGNYELEPVGPGATETKTKVTSGTQGRLSRVPEHQFNLEVSLLVQKKLKEEGYTVVMTRETAEVDISNRERALFANYAKADIFVRIHADGADNIDANGISVLYPSANNPYIPDLSADSKRLAEEVITSMCELTSAKSRGTVPRDDLTGTNFAQMPVIVIECGFLTNEEEEAKLISDAYQEKLADGIIEGINQYFGIE